MGDLITLNCPSCGGELEVNPNTSVLKCRYCGAEHMVHREGSAVSLESYARCPKCRRNDRVEKVTAILRSQPEGSLLVESLAQPERSSPLPKPQLLPRPETQPEPVTTPRPKLNPKPEPPQFPGIEYKRNNYWFIIGGVVLFIFSYLTFIIFLGMSFDIVGEGYRICSGVSLVPLILSIFLFYKGQTWKKGKIENVDSFKKFLNRGQGNPNKQKIIFIALSTILFVISVFLLLFSLLFLPDDIGTFILLLGVSLLPAIFGFFFLVKTRSVKKFDKQKHLSIDEFKFGLEKWEKETERIFSNVTGENTRLLHEWELENQQILERWKAVNAKLLDDWENENNRRLRDWKADNSQIPQQYRNIMERWEELYFCHRDDVVFIPDEGTYAPVEKMYEYLNKNAK